MPNAHYQRSAQRERDEVNAEREKGHVAYRTPGSKGAADVIVFRAPGDLDFRQIKTGGTSAWQDFGPASRQRLLEECRVSGATPYLHWYPAGPSSLLVYPESKWPA